MDDDNPLRYGGPLRRGPPQKFERTAEDVASQRTADAKIERLRQRVITLGYREPALRPVLDLIKGLLDLLEDEL